MAADGATMRLGKVAVFPNMAEVVVVGNCGLVETAFSGMLATPRPLDVEYWKRV